MCCACKPAAAVLSAQYGGYEWDQSRASRSSKSNYKIQTIPLTNNEAAGFCNQEGAELLQVESANEDNVINEILFGVPEYSTPTHPGFYHIGTYQKQTANQYYHRNGLTIPDRQQDMRQ